jgi:hypothetical protein
VLRRINHHFKLINKCQGFTEADKAQVKTFYFEHFVALDAQDHGEEIIRSVRLGPPHAFAPRMSILNAASLCAFPLQNYAKSGARAS